MLGAFPNRSVHLATASRDLNSQKKHSGDPWFRVFRRIPSIIVYIAAVPRQRAPCLSRERATSPGVWVVTNVLVLNNWQQEQQQQRHDKNAVLSIYAGALLSPHASAYVLSDFQRGRPPPYTCRCAWA